MCLIWIYCRKWIKSAIGIDPLFLDATSLNSILILNSNSLELRFCKSDKPKHKPNPTSKKDEVCLGGNFDIKAGISSCFAINQDGGIQPGFRIRTEQKIDSVLTVVLYILILWKKNHSRDWINACECNSPSEFRLSIPIEGLSATSSIRKQIECLFFLFFCFYSSSTSVKLNFSF